MRSKAESKPVYIQGIKNDVISVLSVLARAPPCSGMSQNRIQLEKEILF